MKYILPILVLSVMTFLSARSQPYLFGTNREGNGKIIRYDVKGNKLEVASSFENDGLHPKQFSQPIRVATGEFYGVTSSGGHLGNGVIFKLDSASGKYTIMHEFGVEPAMYPLDQPVLSIDGKLYGIAI